MKSIFSLLILGLALSTQAAVGDKSGDCSAKMIEKIEMGAGRAEHLCQRASRKQADMQLFTSCVIDIYIQTRLAPEIVAPYCMRRNDTAFKECVISTYNSNSNDNAFKTCLGKRNTASRFVGPRYKSARRLAAPGRVSISVL